MSKLPRELEVEEALVAAYTAGILEGRLIQLSAVKPVNLSEERLSSMVKLINATGQALDAQTRILGGLGMILDNAGGLR